MNKGIQSQIRALDTLFKDVAEVTDDEIKSHLAKYLCIKTSGLLENYLKSQIGDYVDNCSSKPTATFVKSKMKTFTNVDNKKLTIFLQSFHEDWLDKYEDLMNDQLRSTLNTVISNRNNIAHGNPDNITFRAIEHYYEDIKLVINHLDTIIKK